ncbi:DUF4019 domain-containing protein [Roseateles aquae]|nr:DUF4019 domain-containing protein [Paucibacter sp. APW11]
MKASRRICCLLGLAWVCSVQAQGAEDIGRAQAAATQWLALSDGGQYAASWDQAAAVFQQSISKAKWEEALKAVRSPLGALKSRTMKSATWTKALPGAKGGPFLVVQYDSEFEHKAGAVETVTPMREADGSWKVSGYFIK